MKFNEKNKKNNCLFNVNYVYINWECFIIYNSISS